MNKVLKFLLPDAQQRCSTAAFLLVARVVFALLLASHGLQKLEGFEQMSGGFPDPLGLGSALSLSLAIFGELVCSLALVVGVLSKLALLPMIFTMCGLLHGSWWIDSPGRAGFRLPRGVRSAVFCRPRPFLRRRMACQEAE